MASPQLENGYTPIANELLEALCKVEFSAFESRVLWFIIRKTYGYRKKQDAISYGQIVEATGLSRRMTIYAIQNLLSKNVISLIHDSTRSNIIGIQKDYELWKSDAVSKTWKNQLEKKRANYHGALVQTPSTSTSVEGVHQLDPPTSVEKIQTSVEGVHQLDPPTSVEKIQTSVEKTPQLVQRNVKTSVPPLHPQKKTKENTKENIQKKDYMQLPLKEQVEIIATELKPNYPDLDFDHQLIKFRAYWFEGKKQLLRPRFALLNWMDKAREYNKSKPKQRVGDDGWPRS